MHVSHPLIDDPDSDACEEHERSKLSVIAVQQKLAPYFLLLITPATLVGYLSLSMTSRLCRLQTQIYTGYLELVNLLCSLLVRRGILKNGI